MFLAALALRALPLALAAAPSYAVVRVGGADDDCCAQRVSAALQSLPFVSGAAVALDGRACVALSGPADLAAIRAVLAPGGYTASAIEPVAACPAGLAPTRADPWANAAGLDVVVVSRGEEVDLAATLAKSKFTVVDFAASWCGPCYPAAEKLAAYLRAHPDTAVRAVVLEGADARVSFALPVVAQHLRWAEGLPYLRVYSPNGKPIYEGSDVDAALATIERRRK